MEKSGMAVVRRDPALAKGLVYPSVVVGFDVDSNRLCWQAVTVGRKTRLLETARRAPWLARTDCMAWCPAMARALDDDEEVWCGTDVVPAANQHPVVAFASTHTPFAAYGQPTCRTSRIGRFGIKTEGARKAPLFSGRSRDCRCGQKKPDIETYKAVSFTAAQTEIQWRTEISCFAFVENNATPRPSRGRKWYKQSVIGCSRLRLRGATETAEFRIPSPVLNSNRLDDPPPGIPCWVDGRSI